MSEGELSGILRQIRGLDWELYAEVWAHQVAGWSRGQAGHALARFARESSTKDTVLSFYEQRGGDDVPSLLPDVGAQTLVLYRQGTERFDQIILMVRTLEAQDPGPGLWETGVLDLPTLASNALGGTRSAKFIEDRIKQQISDHLPIWLRVELPNPLS